MRRLVFVASHLGYPMEKTALGGGAMVGLQLARAWTARGVPLAAIGSGPESPWADGAGASSYIRLPRQEADLDLVRLSERGYARFCRRFERESTGYVLEKFDPRRDAVIVNDISESPDLERLAAAGFQVVSIWHVDVVEYFNRMYLRGALAPERLTRAYSWLGSRGMGRAVPDILRLVFDKQESSVRRSRRIVVPSRPMAEMVDRCYSHLPGAPSVRERTLVVPWGGWSEPDSAGGEDVAARIIRLKEHYQISPRTRVLATLSRISPEKGLHILLEALKSLEEEAPEIEDLCIFVCGEPAFMRGEAYARKVRAAAASLRRFRAFFPGYLSGADKRAYLGMAELFVSPSVHESYGLTLVEAMRAGLPVLASDHHGVEEILRPEFGKVVAYGGSGREARMAGAIRELLAGGRLSGMGAAARAAAEDMSFERAAAAVHAAAEAAP